MIKLKAKNENYNIELNSTHRRKCIRARNCKPLILNKLTPLGGVRKNMVITIENKPTITKLGNKTLTSEKKKLMKSLIGSASSKIDFNKVRDEYKYGKD